MKYFKKEPGSQAVEKVYVYISLSILFWTKSVSGIWRKPLVGNPVIAQKLKLEPNRNVRFKQRG